MLRPEHPSLCVDEGAGWATVGVSEMNPQNCQAEDLTSVLSVTHCFRLSLLCPPNQEADSACAGQAGRERARTRVLVKAAGPHNAQAARILVLFCFCFESLLYARRWSKTSCVNFSCSQQPPKKSLIVINHIKSV